VKVQEASRKGSIDAPFYSLKNGYFNKTSYSGFSSHIILPIEPGGRHQSFMHGVMP